MKSPITCAVIAARQHCLSRVLFPPMLGPLSTTKGARPLGLPSSTSLGTKAPPRRAIPREVGVDGQVPGERTAGRVTNERGLRSGDTAPFGNGALKDRTAVEHPVPEEEGHAAQRAQS